jgi:hypothetical protein
MSSKNYLPYQDADFVVWLQSFSSKLPARAVTFGITPAEVKQFSSYAADAANKLTDLQNTKTTRQSLTQSKNTIQARYRNHIHKSG